MPSAAIEALHQENARLTAFFDLYSDDVYDIWKGGVAKGSVMRPQIYRRIFGEQWATETKILPAFTEQPQSGN